MLPDVAPIAREFDYLVPPALDPFVRVGTMVRINLHGRRVGGWVVGDDVSPPAGVALRPLSKVTGWGPSAELIELAEWAAWRWAGPRAALLKSASPDYAVRGLPAPLLPQTDEIDTSSDKNDSNQELISDALRAGAGGSGGSGDFAVAARG